MLTLFGNLESGNVYKLRLAMARLGVARRRVEVHQARGEPMSPAFRAINPAGKVPAVRFDDGAVLSESEAILHYLAQGRPLWPKATWDQAQALRWMFFEQYSHEPYIAVNRYLVLFAGGAERHAERPRANAEKGRHAPSVMEQHVQDAAWFAGERYSIADIALYAYTRLADEGGFELAGFPAVQARVTRVAEQSGHIGMMQETSSEPVLSLEHLA